MDGSTITALAASLSSATNLAKLVLEMKVDDKVRSSIIELQNSLISAQSAALTSLAEREALQSKVIELETKLHAVEDWQEAAKSYLPREFSTGEFAYVSEREDIAGIFCPKCFENQRLARLQEQKAENGGHSAHCLHCESRFRFRRGKVTPIVSGGGYGRGY